MRISSWISSSTTKLVCELKKNRYKKYLNFQNALTKILFVIPRIKFMSNSKVFCIFKQFSNWCKMSFVLKSKILKNRSHRTQQIHTLLINTSQLKNMNKYYLINYPSTICSTSIFFNINYLSKSISKENKLRRNKYLILNNNIRYGILSIISNIWNNFMKWIFCVASLNDNKFHKNKFRNMLMTHFRYYLNH